MSYLFYSISTNIGLLQVGTWADPATLRASLMGPSCLSRLLAALHLGHYVLAFLKNLQRFLIKHQAVLWFSALVRAGCFFFPPLRFLFSSCPLRSTRMPTMSSCRRAGGSDFCFQGYSGHPEQCLSHVIGTQ